MLWYTLDAFLKAYADLQIVLVVPTGYQDTAKELVMTLAGGERVELANGGDTRFHSVRNGLQLIRQKLGGTIEVDGKAGAPAKVGQDMVIWVHDGVRCLISADLIRRCYEQAVQLGSAVPVVDCRDSVRLVEDEGRSKPIDRSRIKLVQTPQTFRGDILSGGVYVGSSGGILRMRRRWWRCRVIGAIDRRGGNEYKDHYAGGYGICRGFVGAKMIWISGEFIEQLF